METTHETSEETIRISVGDKPGVNIKLIIDYDAGSVNIVPQQQAAGTGFVFQTGRRRAQDGLFQKLEMWSAIGRAIQEATEVAKKKFAEKDGFKKA